LAKIYYSAFHHLLRPLLLPVPPLPPPRTSTVTATTTMTEAYTYYNMCQRVNAGLPAGRYKVEINDRFFAQREKTMAIEDINLLKDLRELYMSR
jgi:hypothetical protein